MRPPRTFGEAVRRLDEAGLARLLALRPDLGVPAPADLAELATRAATATSVQRALERLDVAQRLTAEALAASADPATIADLAALTGRAPDWLAARAAELRARGLLWGADDALHLLREARLAFGHWPGGLAGPSERPLPDPAAVLADTDPDERAVLERLAWGPPTGALRQADRPVTLASARTPVERLLARGLLRPLDADTVIVPREVALAVRGGFARPEVRDTPPPVEAPAVEPARARRVDRAALGAAYACVQEVDALIDELGRMRPVLLRAGGLGASDTSALGRRLGVAPDALARGVAVAERLGMIRAHGGRVEVTTAYDAWLARPGRERWLEIVGAWREQERWPQREPRPLQHEPHPLHGRAPELRALALAELVGVPVGAEVDRAALTARIGWQRPAWQALGLVDVVAEFAADAAWLGLIALGGRGRLAGAAIDGRVPDDLEFPEPVDTLILQADLTAVAAGPVQHEVLEVIRLLADVESRGAATVFRFSPASVRRGLDRGWSAEQITDWLATHSETEVPQPLRYLITDAARRHGTIRVANAGSWLRLDDPAQAALITAHPRAAEFGVRQVAPGVIIAAAEADELVDWLRDLGLSPAAEGPGGTALLAPAPVRARALAAAPAPAVDPALLAERLTEQAERAAHAERGAARLRESLSAAARAGTGVDLTWVDAGGALSRRTGVPLELAAGQVRVRLDEPTDAGSREIWLALGRIRNVDAITTAPTRGSSH